MAAAALLVACDTGGEDLPPETDPACHNGARDPGEEGVDCGGSCPRCDLSPCADDAECASGRCRDAVCAPPADKTCGVGLPLACADGERCALDLDCLSDLCEGTCEPPGAGAHQDGRRNAGETGVDCGGVVRDRAPCPAGQACREGDDCISTCTAGVCDAPGPSDGKKNGGETDVDCGGPNAPGCAVGARCVDDGDCALLACTAGACVVPTSTDGARNGGETDVDCGGPGVSAGGVSYVPPRCHDGKACLVDGDCVTEACLPGGRCGAKSCDTNETAGIVTCGAREVGDPAAAHESCCKSLPLPTLAARRLDKYEITAGRFRTFLSAVGPNVRQWASAFIAANPTSQLATVVSAYPTVLDLYPAALRGQLGLVAHMQIDIDNGGGIRGCYTNEGGYGANTYWMPAADIAEFGLPPRPLPRAVSDAKSLNCAQPIMFAAFCAWDGGELATREDILDAWGPHPYPWGPDDLGRPHYNWCNGRYETGGFKCQDASLGDAGIFYRFPGGTDLANDMEPLIASPGRFPRDATALTSGGEPWMDLYANLGEYTADFTGTSTFCDFSGAPAPGATTCSDPLRPGQLGTPYTGVPLIGVLGTTWEGHEYKRDNVDRAPATFQYGKFGARCVRPAQP